MQQTLFRKNCHLHFWLSGPVEAPLVVFTHGALIDHSEWDNSLSTTLEAGFRTLTWDVRGHGLSRPAPFVLGEAVDDLIAILDSLDVQQATFVGHSMGGNVGQEVAFRYPKRVKALVMLDCTWNFQRLTLFEQFMLKLAGPIFKFYPYDWLVDQSIAMVTKSPQARAALGTVVRKLAKDEIVQIMTALAVCLHEEPGYRIEKPMLMLLGAQDPTGNIRKIMPVWSKHEPDCEFHIIPNALHAPNLDQPEIFQNYLTNFLQRTR